MEALKYKAGIFSPRTDATLQRSKEGHHIGYCLGIIVAGGSYPEQQ
jgi:hypothetical protein